MSAKDILKGMRGLDLKQKIREAELSFQMTQKILEIVAENNKILKQIRDDTEELLLRGK